MTTKTFVLETREQVARFQEHLNSYSVARANGALPHLQLVSIYDYCQTREDGGKLFTVFLDLSINFMLLWCDSHVVGATWNANFSKGKLEGGSALDSTRKFQGKMDIHRFNSSFILRYRAVWDKMMGVLIMLHAPLEYEKFVSAKSRRRSFRKIASRVDSIPMDFVEFLETKLSDFDSEFRTPEAHSTGALRKWSFIMEPMHENPQVKLIGYWNFLNLAISDIGKSFATGKIATKSAL